MNTKQTKMRNKGLIAWMASHAVAANLLMLFFVLGGFFLYTQTTKEVFPEFEFDTISVRMAYPGASPEEVEQSIVLAIENALADIDGTGKITALAQEGRGSVTIEVLESQKKFQILQDIKDAVDRISTFPVDAQDLTVSMNSRRRDVVSLALYGQTDAWQLRAFAEQVRDALTQDPQVGPIELDGVRDYVIQIEVSRENLRRYNLSLPGIAQRVSQTAVELGGGSLETQGGEILLRVDERRENAFEFANVPIITLDNGASVLLGDIATIKDGFDDSNHAAFFNGQPAVLFDVYRVGQQTPISVATAVQEHLKKLNQTLPQGIHLVSFNDRSKLFAQRAELLLKNGLFGLVLVILFLALFLNTRLAFWVSMGIPISFLGAFWIFPATSFTVNVVSMFAFIIALGIVVDDAIICGENIYHYRQQGLSPIAASIRGAREIALPITVSVLTNMIAFVPLLFVPGVMGKVFSIIPVVVISTFAISWIESLFILPAHLTYVQQPNQNLWLQGIDRWRLQFNQGFEKFVDQRYLPFLVNVVLKNRYLAIVLFTAVLFILVGYVASGRMGMTLFPRVESDYAYASARLNVGAPEDKVKAVADRLVRSAQAVIDAQGGERLSTGIFSTINENEVSVRVFLTDPKVRPIRTSAFIPLWREQLGQLSGIKYLTFLSNRGGPGSGAAIALELSHRDIHVLNLAATQLAQALAQFPNTRDIDDGSAKGKKQYSFHMKPLGYTLGMTTADVARQVRASFYGSEVFKQQRGRHEVRVLVRLPQAQRSSDYDIEQLMIRAPNGANVLLSDIVEIRQGRAYTTIERSNTQRIIQVQADVEPASQAHTVLAALQKDTLPQLQQQYPGLKIDFAGNQAEIRDSINSIFAGLGLILFIIYALLAVLFSSYSQPFMVLLAIPFGAVGAIIGHFLMGYSLSLMSLFGFMALSGVVVNDALILVDFVNRKKHQGIPTFKALTQTCRQRIRPIILTTLTTFVGLAPMILETSRQARFLIPMALSLGFGILFATLLTLIFIPALYIIIDDIQNIFKRKQGK